MKTLVVFCVCAVAACAQSGGTVVGAGYHGFAPVPAAPGQVITVFVTGIGNVTQRYSAGTPPLPTTLGGISATFQEGSAIAVPILAVFPFTACANFAQTCSSITAVTLQVPFELSPNNPNSEAPPSLAWLTISDQLGHSARMELSPVYDQIHILGSFDTITGTLPALAGYGIGVVAHPDGTLVDALHPAQPGEELVMFAVGLGAVSQEIKTGAASPSPSVSTVGKPVLVFDYRPNAQPTPAIMSPWYTPVSPVFVGLTPGFVGLYQINFVVPKTPPAAPCARSLGSGAYPYAHVLSNLTVTILGASSFDGVGICVGPTAQ